MTIRDGELLELLRNEPELLAIADAVADTQPRPQRNVFRRKAPRFVTATAVAAGAIVAIVLVLTGGGRHGIVDRALAAIGNGRVLHIVTETPSGVVFVDLQSGRRTVELTRAELWYDVDTKHLHLLLRVRGHVTDVLFPQDAKRPGVSMGRIDPAFTGLVLGYRESLANGSAKLERRGKLDGRPVYWLRFPSAERGRPGTEVAIDARTYKPRLFRQHFGNRHFDSHILVAETVPFRTSQFRRRGPNPFNGRSAATGSSGTVVPARKPPKLTGRWLTAGKRIDGLNLSAVNPASASTDGRTVRGVILFYGPLHVGEAPLTVEELSGPDDPIAWVSIPRGSVAIEKFESSGSGAIRTQWSGHMRKHGIYVTIETTRSEQTIVDVARALRPARIR